MKKCISFLIATVFCLQLISCSSGKINKDSFTPFPVSRKPLLSITNPIEKWVFHIPYKEGDYSIGIDDKPVVDDAGNVYFVSKNQKFYELSNTGKEAFNQNKSLFKINRSLKDGVIANSFIDFNYYDSQGKFIKSFNFNGFEIGPDGMRYYITPIRNSSRWFKALREKKWWNLISGASDAGFASIDYNNKIRWVYPIKQIGEERRELIKCFFDHQFNVYFVVRKYFENDFEEDKETQIFEIYSFTSDGKLRWTKEIPRIVFYGEFIGNFQDFLPDQIVFKDRFLLEASKLTADGKKEEGHIKCFSVDGIELWDYPLPKNKFIRKSYILLENSLFIVALHNLTNNRTFLQAIDQNGKLIWERDMISSYSTPPIKDMEDNIYIGVGATSDTERYIYSFDKTGKTRWSMKQTNSYAQFDTPLVLDSNQQIYYGCDLESILYCIGNK